MRDANILPPDASPKDRMVLHSLRRLWQRQGIMLSNPEYEAIAQGIRAGLYRLVAIGERDCPIYEVTYRNKTVYAVWSKQFDCVKTFLPCRQWIERNHRGQVRVSARAQAAAAFREARA